MKKKKLYVNINTMLKQLICFIFLRLLTCKNKVRILNIQYINLTWTWNIVCFQQPSLKVYLFRHFKRVHCKNNCMTLKQTFKIYEQKRLTFFAFVIGILLFFEFYFLFKKKFNQQFNKNAKEGLKSHFKTLIFFSL